MGQWRLEIAPIPGIGLYVTWAKEEIAIAVPFIHICIGLTKHAQGFLIFGRKF